MRARAFPEILPGVAFVETAGPLAALPFRHRRHRRSDSVTTNSQDERATADRTLVDRHDRQPVPPQQRADRRQREVAEVLMVDRVVVQLVDNDLAVVHFENEYAIRSE